MNNKECYIEFTNNFLTVDYFSEHYGLSVCQARQAIRQGKADFYGLPVLADERYTITREFSGKSGRQYVVRFCDRLIYTSAKWSISADYANNFRNNGHKA